MKRTIEIGDRRVTLESNAVTPMLYKQQFSRDFFRDLIKMAKVFEGASSDVLDLSSLDWDDLDHLEIGSMYDIAWAMAKTESMTSGTRVPEPMEWLASFSDFPLTVFGEILDLVAESTNAKKK